VTEDINVYLSQIQWAEIAQSV